MYNNGDYGATCTYSHHIVTLRQYQGTLISCHTVNITCYTLVVYTNVHNKIYILYLNSCIYQYHDIEVKMMISRSSIMITINIIILCSSIYRLPNFCNTVVPQDNA